MKKENGFILTSDLQSWKKYLNPKPSDPYLNTGATLLLAPRPLDKASSRDGSSTVSILFVVSEKGAKKNKRTEEERKSEIKKVKFHGRRTWHWMKVQFNQWVVRTEGPPHPPNGNGAFGLDIYYTVSCFRSLFTIRFVRLSASFGFFSPFDLQLFSVPFFHLSLVYFRLEDNDSFVLFRK